MHLDLRVVELLSSKLCHDLISPVSAINNGVELIEDIGDSVAVEAMKLIADSGAQASRRLRFFRLSYGRAGSEANLPVKEIQSVAQNYFAASKIKVTWDDQLDLNELTKRSGGVKVLLNMLLIAEEILAYGGMITVLKPKTDGEAGCEILVAGRNAVMPESHSEALKAVTPVDDLSPRTIQSYVTGRFAEHFGFNISYLSSGDDQLTLTLSAPPLDQ